MVAGSNKNAKLVRNLPNKSTFFFQVLLGKSIYFKMNDCRKAH